MRTFTFPNPNPDLTLTPNQVRLLPERVGEVLLHVRMGGQPVMGSPFALRVVAGQAQCMHLARR